MSQSAVEAASVALTHLRVIMSVWLFRVCVLFDTHTTAMQRLCSIQLHIMYTYILTSTPCCLIQPKQIHL